MVPSVLASAMIIAPTGLRREAGWGITLAILGGATLCHVWARKKGFALVGGSVAGGLFFGLCGFLTTLFIPPDSGTVYKWGNGIDAAILTFVLGASFGGLLGCVGGFFYAMIAAIVTESVREHRKSHRVRRSGEREADIA
jgi:hypothetical protein